MARARNLKPSFFTNEELAALSPYARILFAGLWTIADRAGRLEDRPLRIKVAVLPYDDQPVDQLLNDLQSHGFLVRYEVEGKRYIQINTFAKHQNPHKQEQASVIPEFTGLLPNYIGSSSEVARPLSVDLNPQPLTLNPVSPDHSNRRALKRIKPKAELEPEKPYRIPLPEERPADSLVLFYKVLQGAPYDDRPWDRAWSRWKKEANELLRIFGGNYAAAYQCLKAKAEEMTTSGKTWTFNTIVGHSHLWKQQHGGEEHALVNRERFLRDVIEQRRQRKIEGLRKVSTPGEILHERGDRANLPNGHPEGQAHEVDRGNGRNGRVMAPVQSRIVEGEEDQSIQVSAGPSESGGDEHWGNGAGGDG